MRINSYIFFELNIQQPTLKHLFFFIFIFYCTNIQSQVPTITSFTPLSGKPGDVVTITGSNFNTTPNNNIVIFGATKATVTSATGSSLTVTIPKGAIYAPITLLNTETFLTCISKERFKPTFNPTKTNLTAGDFATKENFTTGSTPWSVAVGDIDNDGNNDLLVGSDDAQNIAVLRNISTLGNLAFAPKIDFTINSIPRAINVADIDGDGKIDIIVADQIAQDISILRNTSINGNISFANEVNFEVGFSPRSVAIGDLDGDGKLDVIVGNDIDKISILRNTATSGIVNSGSFATKTTLQVESAPTSVSIADLDGDNKPDIAVTNEFTNSLSLFRNNSSIGTINFGTRQDFNTGDRPQCVSIGDLDDDGKLDIAVACYLSNNISVFRNISTIGNISLATKQDYGTNIAPLTIAIADINGDGKADLTVEKSLGFSVLRNTSTNGSINFANNIDISVGNDIAPLAIGDVDGDYKPDIIFANGIASATVSVVRSIYNSNLSALAISEGTLNTTFNSSTTSYTSSVENNITSLVITPTASDENATIQVRINNGSYTSVGSGISSSALSLNVGINTIEVLVTALDAVTTKKYTVIVTRLPPLTPTISSFTPISAKPGDVVTISGTNFNAIPANNILFFGATKASVITATSTSLTVTVPVGAAYAPITLLNIENNLACESRDRFTPVFTPIKSTISIYDFAARQEFETGSYPNLTVVGDLDMDGKPDAIVLNSLSFSVSIFRNTSSNGSISFSTKQDILIGDMHDPTSLQLGDLDGDGKLDLIAANNESNTVSVLRNTSTINNISFSNRQDFTTDIEPNSVKVADIDNDGKPDIVTANLLPNTVSVLRNTSTMGNISFETKIDFTTGGQPQYIATSDLDNDGKLDLITANAQTNNISVLRNNSSSGTINFATKIDVTTGSNPVSIATGDLNTDGKQDIIIANSGQNNISILRNTSNTGIISFATKIDYATNGSPNSVNIGDMNGDGKPDIFTGNSGSISLFRNISTSSNITLAAKTDINNQAYGISANDIDGDGKSDIIGLTYNIPGKLFVLRNIYTANLSGLTISNGTLSPTFNSNTTIYTTTVTNTVDNLTITPTAIDSNATIQIRVNNGTYSNVLNGTSSLLLPLNVGINTIEVLATAQDGINNKTYLITVTRTPSSNANLSNLSTSSGLLSPNFESTITAYNLSVNNATTTINITPTVAELNATVQVRVNNGTYTTITGGAASTNLALNVGNNNIDVLVTAQDGATTKIYSISVTRLLPASAINIVGTLSAFTSCSGLSSATQSFTVIGNNLTDNVIIRAPSGFEISTDSEHNYSDSIQLTQNGGNVSATIIYVRLSPTATGNVSGNISNSSSGTTTQNISINGIVNTLPTVPTISNNRPLTFCSGDSSVLSTSAANGYQWLLNGNPISGATNQSLTVKAAGNYSVVVTNASGCDATSTVVSILVNALPTVPTISNNRPLTFCSGDSTVLSSSAATGYQWLLNGNPISGATNQSLTVKAAGNYSVVVTNANGCAATSTVVSILVNALPTVPTISNNRPLTFCSGDSTVLSSSAATGYQWLLNGNPISGATNQSLAVKAAGNYSVVVTNASGCAATSTAVAIVVNALPSVPTISFSRPLTFCSGDSSVLSASVANGYQWLLNGNPISGATNQSLTVKAAGNYSVVVTNASGCDATSTAVAIVVNALPSVPTISFSRPLTFCSGDSTVLSASVANGYQWLLNGNPISGATNQTFNATNAGNYSVVVTNASGCAATSTVVAIVVNALPTVPTISFSRPLTFCSGDSSVLSASAANGYQWLLNGNPISGATNQSLTVKAAGNYSVVVTNANGCAATSTVISIVVNALPSVPTISFSRPLTFCSGDSTVLSASAANGYQWLLNGNPISGATNQTFTATNAGNYSVVVTNVSGCAATSTAVAIVVNTLPSVPTISFSRPLTFCSGDSSVLSSSVATGYQWLLNGNPISGANNQTFTATNAGNYSVVVTNASGCAATSTVVAVVVNTLPSVPTISFSRPLTFCSGDSTVLSSSAANGYQWLLNGNPISGATNQTFTATNAGNYSVVVTNVSGCAATSTAVAIVVNTLPSVPTISFSRPLTFCSGDSSVLSSSVATGYQWLLNGNPISGANNQTFTATNAGNYSVVVTNASGCAATSTVVAVVVNTLPTVPTISFSRPLTFCSGDSTVLSSSVANGYQWLLNGNPISGATNQSLTVKAAGNYSVVVTNASGCAATSTVVAVVVNTLPTVPTISNNRLLTFCSGDSTVLSTSVTNGYQWLLNGNPISGATNQSLTVKAAGNYSVVITNASGCAATSTVVSIVVNTLPSVPTISFSRPLTFCSGDSSVLSASAANGYQWLLNGNPISGATNQSLVVRSTGIYAASVFNTNGCSSTSVNVNVTNNSTIGTGLLFRDSLICKATILRVSAQAIAPTSFSWTGVRTGFTSNQQSVTISNADLYRVRITLANGCIVNDSINLRNTVDTAIKAKIAMSSQAFINQTVAIANLTNPKPQTQNWIFPIGATVISQTDTLSRIRFNNVGTYQVIVNNVSYNVCKSSDTAKIVITTNDSSAIASTNQTILRSVTVGPNPTTGIATVNIEMNRPGKVSMRLYNFGGTLLLNRIIDNRTSANLKETIDITSQQSNATYVLIVQTDTSYEVRSIFKQ